MSGTGSVGGGPPTTRVSLRHIESPEAQHTFMKRIRIGDTVWKVRLVKVAPDGSRTPMDVTESLASKVKQTAIKLHEAGALDITRSKRVHILKEGSSIKSIYHTRRETRDIHQMAPVNLSADKVQELAPTVLKDLGDEIQAAMRGESLPSSARPDHSPPSSPLSLPRTPTTSIETPERQLRTLAQDKRYVGFYDAAQSQLTAFLGNFHETPVQFEGISYRCAEAAFQAQKFPPEERARFKDLSGDAAFRLGKSKKDRLPKDWHKNKDALMMQILRKKFEDPGLQRLLLSTDDAYLIEHNPVKGRDRYWSDNNDGSGKNMLGIMLMRLRGELGGLGEVPKPPHMSF